MNRKAQPSWISPEGDVHVLSGKGHSEFAYEILLNEKIGEHMRKRPPLDGSVEQKGKSGEHAKADAARELGDPSDPSHSAALCDRGWVQASDDGHCLIVRAANISRLRSVWCHIASIGSSCDSVVFAIGNSGSGVSAGLCGRDLAKSAESVIRTIADAVDGSGRGVGSVWPQGHGIKYFE